ncbi:MAG: hypothetical protein AB1744_06490, partial [Candidatus Zixiibacteriota bacterium]
MKRFGCFLGATVIGLLLGCSSGYYRYDTESESPVVGHKVEVEAYLFDARLKRHGKPTSFRLDVYYTDSVIALGGRAYLGKGALKGRLTTDSLEVYFPSSNEYLYESVADLLSSSECSPATGIDFLNLFVSLPNSQEAFEDARIVADYSDEGRPEFVVSFPDCPWQINLIYDRRETGWRIRRFYFDDGSHVSLKAEQRVYKAHANVPGSKFHVSA